MFDINFPGNSTQTMKLRFPESFALRDHAVQLKTSVAATLVVFMSMLVLPPARAVTDEVVATLPPGVKAVWDMTKAFHETTATRERICLNGLWQWQPAEGKSEEVPVSNWGWFKVPGCWPGITDYMEKDCQTVFANSKWAGQDFGKLSAAWYQRQLMIPGNWAGRRVAIRTEYLNSFAAVFVDGKRAGEIHFPGGELEITAFCRPGATQTLSVLVVALPLKGVMIVYRDSASAREVKGSVERRGFCGDVYLVSTPQGPRIDDIKTVTSVRKKEITFEAGLDGLVTEASYTLRAQVTQDGVKVKELASPIFRTGDLKEGRIAFTEKWLPDRLWDTHTPQNTFNLELSLIGPDGSVLDTGLPERFGFREFWIEGRDFCLNGTRLYLSAVPLDNAQISAGLATYDAARESLERLKSFGINFVYTHNYGCEPGSHLGFTEILKAADDVGMLVSFSQPHFSHYDWPNSDADRTNGYARHAEFYVRAAQNHPSIVMYSMSHNATGYSDDMNPDLIDGIHDVRDNWALRNVKQARRAEAIVSRLDPSRIVYHHASGNLGPMHVINFYPNFAPVQELSDWFEHWATEGVKPVFTCEYGAPFTWDWTMYRGWYNGKREFGSAAVPWEFCLAEWNAQFFGDKAFQISEPEKANLRWEAKQFQAGKTWHRWDYPVEVGSTRLEERYPVFAKYLTDNWRAFRTWGVSANSPWEHGHFWKLREGVDKRRRELKVDWENLQRPGFSPDYIDQRYERMDLAFERSDWIATPAAQALIRNNRPLLTYIGGKPARFTSKDHNFLPGEAIEKQIIIINNSRESVTCEVGHTAVQGLQRVTVAAGQQERIPIILPIPATMAPGRYELSAWVKFGKGEIQQDTFTYDVMPAPPAVPATGKIAVFDPKDETRTLLKGLGIQGETVEAGTDLSAYDILVVGKSALTVGGPAPDIKRVRDGLKVIIFEQSSEVLEQRFGFRVEEYGLRQVFPRIADHPILAGITAENLRDWRGEATVLTPRVKLEANPKFNGAPTVNWCGMPVTRLWRCGNRGNVASVLIEKPACGDFLPILDGGFSLQYSPLMEYREGKGMVLFCQVDVTGRTESDPAAETMVRNLLRYVSSRKPAPRRSVVYAGDSDGKSHLESTGLVVTSLDDKPLSTDQVLVVGPGCAKMLAGRTAAVADWIKGGGNVLALGLEQDEARALVSGPVTMKKIEHISAFFKPFAMNSPMVGIGPADVHNRDPRELPLITSGAQIVGNGVLARAENANVVYCQLVPWQFEPLTQSNLRRTHRRASFLVSRLLGNLGAAGSTPLLERFHQPLDKVTMNKRWLSGFYVDQPEEWDDPYRFFRW
jgi:hypothetical protein